MGLAGIDVQTALLAFLATSIVDESRDLRYLVDTSKYQLRMALILANQVYGPYAEHSLDESLAVGNIIDVDHVDPIGGSNEYPAGVDESLRGQFIEDRYTSVDE